MLVIGAGNSAFEEGIYLSEFANHLTILARSEVKADEEMVETAKNKENITIIEGEEIKDVITENEAYKVITPNNTIKVDGIFSYIGYSPMTEYLSNLNILESTGYIETKETETLVPGLFACGDIIKKDLYQIVTATSEGALSATKAKNT